MSDQEQGYFTEENSAEVVISRNANAKNERLAEVMAVVTKHLHAAANGKVSSADKFGQIAGKKQDSPGNIVRHSHPA